MDLVTGESMIGQNKCKKFLGFIISLIAITVSVITGTSFYMLDYSLSNDREQKASDTLQSVVGLRDMFVVMPSGERHHALYIKV